ncbi:hypothetical protein [Brachybacterium sp. GPGPB12]|uniref:hypothetical protein n=1 Tax=Brachybacterium sp. GPGPB12 TaxID=3023517 RepID=UPI0031345314
MSSDATSSDSSLDPHNDAAAAEADDGSTGQMVEDVESTAAEIDADGASRGTLRDVANSLGISSAVARAPCAAPTRSSPGWWSACARPPSASTSRSRSSAGRRSTAASSPCS